MSKCKNFCISRDTGTETIRAEDVPIGDMFERNGSLHMRVKPCVGKASCGKITICNQNTGSVWEVSDDEYYQVVKDCEISYSVTI